MTRHAALACLLIALAAADATAQKIYRCGPGGREYSQTPCPAGREIDASDPRSAEQQRDARAAAAADAKLARELADERRARERDAATRGLGPAGIKPAAAPDPAARSHDNGQGRGKDKKKAKKRPAKDRPDRVSWSATAPRRP